MSFNKEKFASGELREKIIFPLILTAVAILSVIMRDGGISTFAAVCGISYTILAGKGKIYCYFIGMAGTLCYAYLAFKNALFGNCALYALYYFPMEIIGIFKWKKHIDEKKQTIVKTSLGAKEHILAVCALSVISVIVGIIMKKTGDTAPFSDSFATVFSVYGMYLTVKRCKEQWDVWFFVNLSSFLAWMKAYIEGSGAFAMLLMWIIYLFLAVYFKLSWEREMKNK